MKKFAFLSLVCLCGLVVSFSANASGKADEKNRGCKIGACLSNGDDCLGTNPWRIGVSTTEINMQRSYMCEKDYCRGGDIVASRDAEHVYMCIEPMASRNIFGFGNDKWVDYKPYIQDCSPEHISMLKGKDIFGRIVFPDTPASEAHIKKTIVNDVKGQLFELNSSNNVISVKNDDICFAYICEYGYVPDAKKKHCVEKADCETLYAGDPEKISCCHGEERGEAEWIGTACYCKDDTKIWDGNKCIGGGVGPVAGCRDGEELATRTIVLKKICPYCDTIYKGRCYDSEKLRCYEAIERNEPANWNGKTCNCGNVDGIKYSWNTKLKKCEAAAGKSCAELYKGYPERIACCKAGRYTKWEGPKDSGKCICVNPDSKAPNPDLEWVYDATSQSGICKAKTPEPVVTEDPKPQEEKDCWYTFYGEFKCGNGTRVKKNYQFKLSKDELKGMTCDKFQERYRTDARGIEDLFKKLCLDPANVEQQPLDAATKRAISNINSFFDMSESNRSVWRDTEGQFNTARLASDATAGVVLGTVGGIVSAKVIKKKQLEKGFDVLHCTVGGQKMADYGDTFQVSYMR